MGRKGRRGRIRIAFGFVRPSVLAVRVLDYEMTQDWAPIRKALGVPVPDRPFPHTNVAGEGLEQVGTQLIRS